MIAGIEIVIRCAETGSACLGKIRDPGNPALIGLEAIVLVFVILIA